jgi:hypothetical protein
MDEIFIYVCVNSIERAVNKLDALNCLEHTADR